jgi:hypothetical protein
MFALVLTALMACLPVNAQTAATDYQPDMQTQARPSAPLVFASRSLTEPASVLIAEAPTPKHGAKKHADAHKPAAPATAAKDLDSMAKTGPPPPLVPPTPNWMKTLIGAGAGGFFAVLFLTFSLLGHTDGVQKPYAKIFGIAAVLLGVGAFAGPPVYDQIHPEAKKDTSKSTEFHNFKSSSFQFKVNFPEPLYIDKKLEQNVIWVTYLTYSSPDGCYSMIFSRLTDPNQDPEGLLDRVAGDTSSLGPEAANTHVEKTLFSQFPGRQAEGTLSGDKGIFKRQVYVGLGAIYQIATYGTPKWVNSNESTEFLNSLQIGTFTAASAGSHAAGKHKHAVAMTAVESNNPSHMAAAKPVETGSRVASNNPIVGTWQWYTNDYAVFYPNGTARHGDASGSWTLDGKTLRISWSDGWYNTLTLSNSKRELNGHGSQDPKTLGTQHVWARKTGS